MKAATGPGTITVRRLRPEDLPQVVALDARITGRRREEYFRGKTRQALEETGVQVSLAAEAEGLFAGFLLARVYYGEFGCTEPTAVLDTIGVNPGFARRGVGRALLAQLRTNLLGLGVGKLSTEVSWDDGDLAAFFRRQGFRPAERLCLDLDLEAAAARARAREEEEEAKA